jgi:hypothetical protein
MHFISRFEMKKITKKHQTTSIRSGHAATAHRSCSHCTQVMQPLHTGHAATAHRSCSHCTQVMQPLHTGLAATAHRSCSHCTSVLSNSAVARFTTFPYFGIGLPTTLALARSRRLFVCAWRAPSMCSWLYVHRNDTDHPDHDVHTVMSCTRSAR